MRKAMTGLAVTAMFAAMLTGCGDNGGADADGDGTISSEEVAEAARDAVRPEPGQYRATMEVQEVDIPGAPPQAVDMMRSMMEGQSHEYCLTQADVEEGFEAMARQSQDGDCTFSKFDVDGGSIDAAMTCQAPDGGGEMAMTMTGTAKPTSSVMNMTMRGNMTGEGESTIRMRTTHERIGDCPA